MVRVPHAPHRDGVGHDILRQGHPEVTGIAQVVDIGARHLAHEGNALDRVSVSALLRGADGSNGQCAVLVGACDQALGVLLRDAGHSAGGQAGG